jgi:hypothetical protein
MKEFDRDGDGRLSEEERKAAMDAWRQRRGQQGAGRAPRR